jgi:hypothetical protein
MRSTDKIFRVPIQVLVYEVRTIAVHFPGQLCENCNEARTFLYKQKL